MLYLLELDKHLSKGRNWESVRGATVSAPNQLEGLQGLQGTCQCKEGTAMEDVHVFIVVNMQACLLCRGDNSM